MAILAVQAIRRMAGGAQAYLILGADGNFWVVKFQNNPQHLYVLANEFIVSSLASAVGLSVPEFGIIEVTPWLASESRNLVIDFGKGRIERCAPGLQFGSRLVEKAFDFLDTERLCRVANISEFAGFVALDKWTNNCDKRQAVFSRGPRQKRYRASFIDHGYCFPSGESNFADADVRGTYPRNTVYQGVKGWASFSPWLESIEEMPPETIWKITESVPLEWLGGDVAIKEKIVTRLIDRRHVIRDRITAFKESPRAPFPNWTAARSAPRQLTKKTSLRQSPGVC